MSVLRSKYCSICKLVLNQDRCAFTTSYLLTKCASSSSEWTTTKNCETTMHHQACPEVYNGNTLPSSLSIDKLEMSLRRLETMRPSCNREPIDLTNSGNTLCALNRINLLSVYSFRAFVILDVTLLRLDDSAHQAYSGLSWSNQDIPKLRELLDCKLESDSSRPNLTAFICDFVDQLNETTACPTVQTFTSTAGTTSALERLESTLVKTELLAKLALGLHANARLLRNSISLYADNFADGFDSYESDLEFASMQRREARLIAPRPSDASLDDDTFNRITELESLGIPDTPTIRKAISVSDSTAKRPTSSKASSYATSATTKLTARSLKSHTALTSRKTELISSTAEWNGSRGSSPSRRSTIESQISEMPLRPEDSISCAPAKSTSTIRNSSSTRTKNRPSGSKLSKGSAASKPNGKKTEATASPPPSYHTR